MPFTLQHTDTRRATDAPEAPSLPCNTPSRTWLSRGRIQPWGPWPEKQMLTLSSQSREIEYSRKSIRSCMHSFICSTNMCPSLNPARTWEQFLPNMEMLGDMCMSVGEAGIPREVIGCPQHLGAPRSTKQTAYPSVIVTLEVALSFTPQVLSTRPCQIVGARERLGE